MNKSKVLIPHRAKIFVYKSIYGETSIPLSPSMHYLIGANGAGKSTLLEALSLIGQGYELPNKWTPKFLTISEQAKLKENTKETAILEVEFKAFPELFGSASSEDAKDINTIFVTLYASGETSFKSNIGKLPLKNIRYSSKFSEAFDLLYKMLHKIADGNNIDNAQIVKVASSCYKSEKREIILTNIQKLIALLTDQSFPEVAAELAEFLEAFNKFNELYKNPPDWVNDIASSIPIVTFIPPRYELPDKFTIKDVESATDGSLLSARKLLTLGGITPESIKGLDANEIQQAMHQASERLTKLITKNWRQESLELMLSMSDDSTLTLTIRDSTGAFISPSECSEGLKWFLPFFINLAVDLGDEWEDGIILIDDPGVYLHPEAQKDVRALLQKLSKKNTVVVCTHSPFILDTSQTANIYVVNKLEGKRGQKGIGTHVLSPKESGWEDKAVIRAAIGLTIGDTLFGNKITLVLEGQSDRIYIEAILNQPDMDKRLGVNTNDVGLLNAMGADKIEFYANWCYTENRPFCVILDNDSKGRGRKERLKTMELEKYTLLIDENFVRDDINKGDSSIEDILSTVEFDKLAAYSGNTKKHTLDEIIKKTNSVSPNSMNVKRSEKALEELAGKKVRLDKVLVASKFANVINPESEIDDDKTISISDTTKDKFRDLIKKAIDKAKID